MKKLLLTLSGLLSFFILIPQSEAGVSDFGFSIHRQFNYPCNPDTLLGYGPLSVKLDPGGQILVTGNELPLCVIKSDGTLDRTAFNNDTLFNNYPDFEKFNGSSILVTNDGTVLVAGTYNSDFAVVQYNASGEPDISFGNSGLSLVDFNDQMDILNAATLQNDGKIVLAGYTQYGSNGRYSRFILARLNTDGSPDQDFGENGKVITEIDSLINHCESVALQSDGKIIAAGWVSDYTHASSAIVRYTENGIPDGTFGNKGVVQGNIYRGFDLILREDDKILIGGMDSSCFAMEQYDKQGNIDTSFGNQGKVITDFSHFEMIPSQKSTKLDPPYAGSVINTFYLQNDGKIMASGLSEGNLHAGQAFARYLSNGDVDTSFYHTGKTVIDFGKLGWWTASSYVPYVGCVFAFEGFSSENNDEIVIYSYQGDIEAGLMNLSNNQIMIEAYPNPVKSNLKLAYQLSESGTISIDLYAITGEKMAVLQQKTFREKGNNMEELMLPISITSGLYILTLTADDNTSSIKMQILK